MKTAGGMTEAAPPGSSSEAWSWPRILKWIVTAALATFAAVCMGELAISLAWLVVGSNGHWRDRSTGHALLIGCMLGLLLLLSLTATRRSSVLVRASAASVVAGLFVIGLASVPTTLGGLKPTCAVVHWSQAAFTQAALDAIEIDGAAPASMELLYSDDYWHHFRLPDGRHLEVPRDRVAALQTCQEQQ